jgi:predicted TPR repeat methyltransferase
MTQNNLGTAYRTLAEVKEKAENCQKAITAYKEALKVYTEDKFPDPHQVVKSNLTAALNFCSDG